MQIVSKISNASKPWKKDIYDALSDARFFQSPPAIVREGWLPVLGQLSNADKGLFTELSSRLTTPAAAGLMFGVGASAARLDADKKTQLNLRRLAIVVLAAEEDAISIESIRVSSLRRAIGNGCPSSLRAGVLQNSLSHYLPSPDPFEKLFADRAVYVDQDGGDTNGDASFFSFIHYKGRSIHASQSFSTKIQLNSVSTHLAYNQR
jgi:DNA-binding transcriptional ArsR family regulator